MSKGTPIVSKNAGRRTRFLDRFLFFVQRNRKRCSARANPIAKRYTHVIKYTLHIRYGDHYRYRGRNFRGSGHEGPLAVERPRAPPKSTLSRGSSDETLLEELLHTLPQEPRFVRDISPRTPFEKQARVFPRTRPRDLLQFFPSKRNRKGRGVWCTPIDACTHLARLLGGAR